MLVIYVGGDGGGGGEVRQRWGRRPVNSALGWFAVQHELRKHSQIVWTERISATPKPPHKLSSTSANSEVGKSKTKFGIQSSTHICFSVLPWYLGTSHPYFILVNDDCVTGFHNWIQFYHGESKGNIYYRGYIILNRVRYCIDGLAWHWGEGEPGTGAVGGRTPNIQQ